MRIAVVGSYGAGLTMRVPRSPEPGETVTGGKFSIAHGGKGSNQAVAAARLGASVSFCTALGDDAFAAGARQLWMDEGVQATVTTGGEQTMVGIIMVEPSGENRIALASGALDDLDSTAVDHFEDQIAAADALLVCLEIPLATAAHALRLAKAHSVRTILNPAPAPDGALPAEVWPLIDVLTPNETEALALVGVRESACPDPDAIAKLMPPDWRGTLVMTLGAAGALIVNPEMHELIPARTPRHVVDTTGAGDSFNAALAVALARGDDWRRAVTFANSAGAHTVTIHEVIPSLPFASDLAGSIG